VEARVRAVVVTEKLPFADAYGEVGKIGLTAMTVVVGLLGICFCVVSLRMLLGRSETGRKGVAGEREGEVTGE